MTIDPRSPAAREVPPTSQRLTTRDPGARYITIINRYAVAPEREEELLDLLVRATVETMRYLPGFAGATFQMSVDRAELVNYTQWRNRESIETAGADPKVAALLLEAAQFAVSRQTHFETPPYAGGRCVSIHWHARRRTHANQRRLAGCGVRRDKPAWSCE